MNQPSIVVNGVTWTRDGMINGTILPQSNFEKCTLDFCKAWIGGNESFTLTTSGSTGDPKQITFTREQMVASARMTEAALELKPNHSALVCLDTRFIAGQMMLVRCFVTGMNIVAVEPAANPLNAIAKNQKIDFAAFIPYQVAAMLAHDHEKLNQVGVAIIGGGQVDKNLKSAISNLNGKCYATYGMTETISHVALMRLNGAEPDDCFNSLPGVSISMDHRGCLVVKTTFLDSEVTTNDLVEVISARQFKWLGRWDNIINSGGIKVIPEKVEQRLNEVFNELKIPGRFFVAGVDDKNLGQRVCLFLEGEKPSPEHQKKLLAKMKMALSQYEGPREIRYVKKFVETNTGKINRPGTINLYPV